MAGKIENKISEEYENENYYLLWWSDKRHFPYNRVPKWWRHKNDFFEIMGYDVIFL